MNSSLFRIAWIKLSRDLKIKTTILDMNLRKESMVMKLIVFDLILS